jgi:uncharacterized protein (TIGR03435 family)
MEVRVDPGGRLELHSQSLLMLIVDAFDLSFWQITGTEKKWFSTDSFNIEGLPPDDVRKRITGGEYAWYGLANADERAMLQSLLIERFHLKYHMEKGLGTVYLLQRDNRPLNLRAVETHLYAQVQDGSAKSSDPYPTGDIAMVSGKPLGFTKTSMTQLARTLSDARQAPVIDKTGLPGFYDFESKTVVTDEDFKNGGLAHLLPEAIPEMGLKLVKTQGEVEKLVIDNAELPSAN